MTTMRAAKKWARPDVDISPSVLRKFLRTIETPRAHWVTGTRAQHLAISKLDRRTKTTRKRKSSR